jgi:DNA mismatch endonuclease (patch repair protein)
MADTVTREQRSDTMRRVLSRNNRSTELRAAALFRELGVTGWRRQSRLTGKPDFIFAKQKIAVFIDGCFWHGCPQHCRRPATNVDYWFKKISRNQARDAQVTRALKRAGWRVVRIWECSLRGEEVVATIRRLKRLLRAND